MKVLLIINLILVNIASASNDINLDMSMIFNNTADMKNAVSYTIDHQSIGKPDMWKDNTLSVMEKDNAAYEPFLTHLSGKVGEEVVKVNSYVAGESFELSVLVDDEVTIGIIDKGVPQLSGGYAGGAGMILYKTFRGGALWRKSSFFNTGVVIKKNHEYRMSFKYRNTCHLKYPNGKVDFDGFALFRLRTYTFGTLEVISNPPDIDDYSVTCVRQGVGYYFGHAFIEIHTPGSYRHIVKDFIKRALKSEVDYNDHAWGLYPNRTPFLIEYPNLYIGGIRGRIKSDDSSNRYVKQWYNLSTIQDVYRGILTIHSNYSAYYIPYDKDANCTNFTMEVAMACNVSIPLRKSKPKIYGWEIEFYTPAGLAKAIKDKK